MGIRHGRMAKAGRRGIGGTGDMNKSAIVARVAARMGLDKFTAEGAVDTVFEAIADGLAKEEDVRIAGFGTFGTRSRAARMGRNPRTGESVPIPASKSPSFKAAKGLREAVKRGRQAEPAEAADVQHEPPGSAGVMLEMSDWPGGVEPVWTLLEPESMEALRVEPLAENPTVRLATDLPDEAFAGSAFVANALIALQQINDEFLPSLTDKGNFGREMVAAMREAMTWPGMEATEQYRAGKALREGDVWELHLLHRLMDLAGLIEGAGGAVPVDASGARDAQARKTRRAPGAPVQATLLAREPFAVRGDVSPRAAGPVAAGRYRRDPLGALERGRRMAERGHAHDADRGSRGVGCGPALERGGHDVREPGAGAAAMVRTARTPGACGDLRGGLAEIRPVRSLPVV